MRSSEIEIPIYNRSVTLCLFEDEEEIKGYLKNNFDVDIIGLEVEAYAANDGKQFYLLFNSSNLEDVHIVHECMHLVYWTLDDAGIILSDETQEAYCYLMGYLFTEVKNSLKLLELLG